MSLELILHRINPRQKTQCFKARYLVRITENVSQLNIQTAPANDKIANRFSDIEISEYVCAPQVKKDEVPVPERSNEQSRLMVLFGH
jgi:hypothetical protein